MFESFLFNWNRAQRIAALVATMTSLLILVLDSSDARVDYGNYLDTVAAADERTGSGGDIELLEVIKPSWMRQRGRSTRRRRSLSPTDQITVANTLNTIRRRPAASNMYYVNWDPVLASYASGLVQTCDIQTKPTINFNVNNANYFGGITGYLTGSTTIDDEMNYIMSLGPQPNSSYVEQVMASSMVSLGCQLGELLCDVPTTGDGAPVFPSAPPQGQHPRGGQGPPPPPSPGPMGPRPPPPPTSAGPMDTPLQGRIFTCIFGYTKPVDPENLYTVSASTCSNCDSDAITCDHGLCRTACSSTNDPTCDKTCQSACSSCDAVTMYPNCSCICYYNGPDSRCLSDSVQASASRPMCFVGNPKPPVPNRSMWIGLAVIACVLLMSIVCLLSWVTHRRLRNRLARHGEAERHALPHRSADETTVTASEELETLPNTPIVEPIVNFLSPPPYESASDTDPFPKPPPYSEIVQFDPSPPAYHAVPIAPEQSTYCSPPPQPVVLETDPPTSSTTCAVDRLEPETEPNSSGL